MNFNYIKKSQDQPLSVSDLRLLDESIEYLRRDWNNTAFNCSLFAPVLVADFPVTTPRIYIQPDCDDLEIAIWVKGKGSAVTLTVTVILPSGESQAVSWTLGTLTNESYYQFSKVIENSYSGGVFLKNSPTISLSIDFGSGRCDLYSLAVYSRFDDYSAADPQEGLSASALDLQRIAFKLNRLYNLKKWVGGFLGRFQVTYTSYTTVLRYLLYYDKTDSELSLSDRDLFFSGLLECTLSAAGAHFLRPYFSGQNLIEEIPGSADGDQYFGGSISATGTYSSAYNYLSLYSSATNDPYLRSIGYYSRATDPSARNSGNYKTAIPENYFKDQDFIESTQINELGRAIFNSLVRRPGDIASAMHQTYLTVGTSSAVFCRGHLWNKNNRLTNIYPIGSIRLSIDVLAYSYAAQTLYINVENQGDNDTAGIVFAAAGWKYEQITIDLKKDSLSADLMDFVISGYKSSASQLNLYSLAVKVDFINNILDY